MDANSKDDFGSHTVDGKIVPGSTVDERQITYDIKKQEIIDKAFRVSRQSNIEFIHEEKADYDAKRDEAIKYVTDVFKRLLGRDMSDKEKEEYADKLMMMTVTTPQQLEATVRKLPEYEQRIAELRKEMDNFRLARLSGWINQGCIRNINKNRQ